MKSSPCTTHRDPSPSAYEGAGAAPQAAHLLCAHAGLGSLGGTRCTPPRHVRTSVHCTAHVHQ
eukprot:7362607-Alexandrium_andersonii.AAC.1